MNPYQEVIDWLESPEGTAWSENRIRTARLASNFTGGVYYGTDDCPRVLGIFSLKTDDKTGYSAPMWWGSIPGDDALARRRG